MGERLNNKNPLGDGPPQDSSERGQRDFTRQYLLGELSEEELEQIEKRLLSEEDYLEELLIAEEELTDDFVSGIRHINEAGIWMNGGYFLFRQDIFKYMRDGEELVQEPFQRLIQKKQLLAYKYNGFWACMDTFKEKQTLDDMYARGEAPWEVWKSGQKNEVELINA